MAFYKTDCPCGNLYLSETYGGQDFFCKADGKLCGAAAWNSKEKIYYVAHKDKCDWHLNPKTLCGCGEEYHAVLKVPRGSDFYFCEKCGKVYQKSEEVSREELKRLGLESEIQRAVALRKEAEQREADESQTEAKVLFEQLRKKKEN